MVTGPITAAAEEFGFRLIVHFGIVAIVVAGISLAAHRMGYFERFSGDSGDSNSAESETKPSEGLMHIKNAAIVRSVTERSRPVSLTLCVQWSSVAL